MVQHDAVIIKTAHGGFHIYCSFHCFPRRNRYIAADKIFGCGIDIFFASHPSDKSGVVFPGSRIKDKDSNTELLYSFVRGDENATSLPDVEIVVNSICNISDLPNLRMLFEDIQKQPIITEPKPKEISIPTFVTFDLFKNLIERLKDFSVSKYQDNNFIYIGDIFKSLNSLEGINSITFEEVNQLYLNLRKIIPLSQCNQEEWSEIFLENKNMKSNWNDLLHIFKKRNKKYFDQHITPLLLKKKELKFNL